MEINTDIEFIAEYEGVYVFRVQFCGESKLVMMTEEDLEDDP